ncbi:MAG: SPOR domain-containing protein [Burkholderia sp.]
MGIFSFSKKKNGDAPSRYRSQSGSWSLHRERVERCTTRRAEQSSDAMMLDPTLSEKQRARRRLVGAIALVVAAVIVLPMILDTHPKPVTDDIAIDIPNKPAYAGPSRDEDPVDTQTGVVHDELTATDTVDDTQTAQSATSSDSTVALVLAKPAQQQTSQQVVAKPTTAQPLAHAATANGTSPSQATGARFAVQLGLFPEETTALGWAEKLKAAGVPAYVEPCKQADGSATTRLRAGPFADRAAASAAIAKVRDTGLTQ